jgi:hypothetical protein
MTLKKILSLVCLLSSIASAIIQNNVFSFFPTVLAIAFSILGFAIALHVRRKNREDKIAMCLIWGNALIWVGYAGFLLFMTCFWSPNLKFF